MSAGAGDGPPWDPLGLWRQVAGLARPLAAGAAGMGALGARTALQVLLEIVKAQLVGRRLSLGTPERPLELTLTALDVVVDPVLMAAGQADRAVLAADDVRWGAVHFASGRAELRNVHTRPGTRPVLVAAPVDLEAVLPVAWLTEQLSRRTQRVVLEVTDEGAARLRLERYPELGWVDVTAQAEGGVVMLRPSGVGARGHGWALSRLLPPFVVPLGLPDAVRVTGLTPTPEGLRVRLRADEWRLDYGEWLSFARRSGEGDAP